MAVTLARAPTTPAGAPTTVAGAPTTLAGAPTTPARAPTTVAHATSARLGRSLFDQLHAFGDRLAVHADGRDLSYAEFADLAADRARDLGPGRRLVLLAGDNNLNALATYVAAVSTGHPVLLVPGDHPHHMSRLIETYDPDVVAANTGEGWTLESRRERTRHEFDSDLALLLSTSGSTGSPKLVRLSHDNLRSNAASIASFLGITERDRAITSLPVHYCYGLSVVNSHLLTGAGLLLTDLSVVDECFWKLACEQGATSFAGVPYTFELLDQSGFADREVPSLRYVTQAGGRLSPDRVVAYAELGRRRGWDFFVMYGQTEATARMAYLPPEVATRRPDAIGIPIPGGSFRLETNDDSAPPCGELVYEGPNVMMGYATSPADLALGETVAELRTGDLARKDSDGMWALVGRKSRFAKVFGCRVDLDDVERHLDASRIKARCVSHDGAICVFVEHRRHVAPAGELAAQHCGLPRHAVRVIKLEAMPLTTTGKADYRALERHAYVVSPTPASPARNSQPRVDRVRDLYAELLGRPDATLESSFVSLGGDSLSYVELSVRLGEMLDVVPRNWHTQSIRQLGSDQGDGSRSSRRWSSIETSVALRAAAIVLIVASHADLFMWYGGAHILLGIAGFNFARFQLNSGTRGVRLRSAATSLERIIVPSVVWIGAVALLTGMYEPATALLLNGAFGSDQWTVQWQFWFLEALVWTIAAIIAVMAIPAVDHLERRAPFGFSFAVVAVALGVRYALVGIEAGPSERYTPSIVLWCFALGWTAARAQQWWQRVLVTVVSVVAVYGFFGDLDREATVAVGLVTLVWLRAVRLPRRLAVVVGVVASSSLYVYLTHWQVYPHLEVDHPLLAVLASFAVGIACWRAAGLWGRVLWPRCTALVAHLLLPRRHPRPTPTGVSAAR